MAELEVELSVVLSMTVLESTAELGWAADGQLLAEMGRNGRARPSYDVVKFER